MDILGSSLTSPSVPMESVARFQLAKKRGPSASDQVDPSQSQPLVSPQRPRKRTTLLDRARATLHMSDTADDLDVLVTSPQQPGVFRRMLTAAGQIFRRLFEALVNGFVGAAEAGPY